MRDSDVQTFRQTKEELTKLRQLAEFNSKAIRQRYLPISKFCEEYDITYASLYKYQGEHNAKILKKFFGKTYVDIEQVETLMKDYNEQTKKKS